MSFWVSFIVLVIILLLPTLHYYVCSCIMERQKRIHNQQCYVTGRQKWSYLLLNGCHMQSMEVWSGSNTNHDIKIDILEQNIDDPTTFISILESPIKITPDRFYTRVDVTCLLRHWDITEPLLILLETDAPDSVAIVNIQNF